jgi:S-methylmethionine-dependent homocysteine/selenocysteine methylase
LTSYSNNSGAKYQQYSFSFTSNNDDASSVEVMVKAAPDEMVGIKCLWKIAINCQNIDVGKFVARMLLQLHTNTDFGQDHKIILFEDQFIGSCFRIIEH